MRRFLAENADRLVGRGMPLAKAAFASFALLVALGVERHAAASPPPPTDTDGDFLSNAQEWVLGTNPNQADTDSDGFSDLEELARGSSPLFASQVPTSTTPVRVGMTAHSNGDGKIHIVIAMYSTVLNPREIQLTFGAQIDQRVFTMAPAWLATHSTMQVGSGSGQSLLTLVDVPFDIAPILAAGHMTFFASVSLGAGGTTISADTVQLQNVDGVVALVASPPRPVPGQVPGGGSLTPGSIYIPLPAGGPGSVPSSWSEGSVCFQRSTPVAVNGAVVTQEVVSASCIEGFDGYCPPSCAASVGQTYSTVDPIGLIGG